MKRIRTDPRHFDPKTVMRYEVQARAFGSLSLVAAVVAPSLEQEFDRVIGLCEAQAEAAIQTLLVLVER